MPDYIEDNSQNPRVQCHMCAKWMRIYNANGDQLMFGGDSNPCGQICRKCMDKHFPECDGENMAICPKCTKKDNND